VGFSCGIIGLPNVGKTTLFNALCATQAPAENYPFCTVDPNHGVVPVPDPRLDQVAAIFKPDKLTPTTLEFVDIAGLVAGASHGEGLGSQFLAQIQQVDAIAHVVRCFEDDNIAHQYDGVDPVRDVEVVQTELIIRDLDMAQRRLDRQRKVAQAGDKAARGEVEILERVEKTLSAGGSVSALELDAGQFDRISATPFLTAKPVFYVANISDDQIGAEDDAALNKLREFCSRQDAPLVEISAVTEAELHELAPEEQQAYLAEIGLSERGLTRVIAAGYRLLNLITFFTTVGTEVRAWTIPAGTSALEAAGKIHTDMQRGFIRAEVVESRILIQSGSEQAVREKGQVRLEGKEYKVKDGDVIRFRFNV